MYGPNDGFVNILEERFIVHKIAYPMEMNNVCLSYPRMSGYGFILSYWRGKSDCSTILMCFLVYSFLYFPRFWPYTFYFQKNLYFLD